ncbi:MAG TPA: thioesterase family protein [Flavobacterium sp.]|nr:thioesterase family protein [Flavobacterium sp.]
MKNINIDDFKFKAPIPIRWNDLDPLGHVNNVYYFEYFQTGRGLFMQAISKDWDWTKNMFVIAHIACDYFVELKLTDRQPMIRMRTSSIGTKSFEIEYLITSLDKNGQESIHAKGKSIQVIIDVAQKRSIEIPDWLRQDLTNYDNL